MFLLATFLNHFMLAISSTACMYLAYMLVIALLERFEGVLHGLEVQNL